MVLAISINSNVKGMANYSVCVQDLRIQDDPEHKGKLMSKKTKTNEPPKPSPEAILSSIGRKYASDMFATQVHTHTHTFHLNEITSFEFELPDFQRGYVWTEDQAVAFMDRFRRGMPMGAILVWQRSGMATPMLLDGQQRLISLGAKVYRDGEQVKGHTVYMDPVMRSFTCKPGIKNVSLSTLAQDDFWWEYPASGEWDNFTWTPEEFGFLKGCHSALRNMCVTTIVLGDHYSNHTTYEVAKEFFRCYNAGGTPIREEDLPK